MNNQVKMLHLQQCHYDIENLHTLKLKSIPKTNGTVITT